MVVVLLAFVAAHHQTANSLVRQQRLVHCQVCEISLDRGPLLQVQRLPWLDGVEGRRGVARVIGERIRRQTRWEVITHVSTLRSGAGIAPAVDGQATWVSATQCGTRPATSMPIRWVFGSATVPGTGGPTHVDR